MSLPHSDACFVKAYPGETTEAFCDGHVSGFSFFGGVPRSDSFMTTPRLRWPASSVTASVSGTRVFSELRSHYLFEDALAAPARGTTRARSRGSSAIAAGTSWCRCQVPELR